MKTLKSIFFYVAIPITLFVSCKKDHTPGTEPDPVVVLGTITGKIVAANNTSPISNATVFTNNGGVLYITHADQSGTFTLQAPAGNRHLTIQSGDGSMFRTEMDIVVIENQTTSIASQPVSLTQVASLAYIPGAYDKIESILIDSLGYTATAISWHSLDTFSNITPYDAIFINCTSPGADMPIVTTTTDQNLGDYVANGGSLYVSDFAIRYLVGSTNDPAVPCSTAPAGGFINDNLFCSRKTGTAGSIMNASITSPSLQAYLNATSINEIVYNLGSWEKINYIDPTFWETMVADQTGNPLLIRTNQYTSPAQGTVQVGSAANAANSLICVPGVNGSVTLSVRTTDVPAYVSAGATSGACDNLDNGGRIYYTTFHNEPNGHIAPDIKNILQYVILNL